jgi:hypothetical protein
VGVFERERGELERTQLQVKFGELVDKFIVGGPI